MPHWNNVDKVKKTLDDLSQSIWDALIFQPDSTEDTKAPWDPEKHVAGTISEDQIAGTIIAQEPDPITLEIIRIEFLVKEGKYELSGASLNALDELCNEFLKGLDPELCVDSASIKENVLGWLVSRINSDRALSFRSFMESAIDTQVGEYEVWVQIGGIEVEEPFSFGCGRICGVDEEMIDTWVNSADYQGQEDNAVRQYAEYFKSHWQGRTAAVTIAKGIESSVERRGIQYAERACGLLRLLEPTNPSIVQRSFLEPLVELSNAGHRRVLVNPGIYGRPESTSFVGNGPINLRLTRENFRDVWDRLGLERLHTLLSVPAPSSFQLQLLKSILIFTRHRIVSEPVEKLILAFAGLESLLLAGDKSVSIRSTLKRRFASALSMAGGEIENPKKCLNTAYDIRSEFLHHGLSLTQRRAASEFLFGSWVYFTWAVLNHEHWSSVDEHCRFLD